MGRVGRRGSDHTSNTTTPATPNSNHPTDQPFPPQVSSASFEEYEVDRRRGVPILEPMITDVVALAAHPTRCLNYLVY